MGGLVPAVRPFLFTRRRHRRRADGIRLSTLLGGVRRRSATGAGLARARSGRLDHQFGLAPGRIGRFSSLSRVVRTMSVIPQRGVDLTPVALKPLVCAGEYRFCSSFGALAPSVPHREARPGIPFRLERGRSSVERKRSFPTVGRPPGPGPSPPTAGRLITFAGETAVA